MRTNTKKMADLTVVTYRFPPDVIKAIVKAAKKDGVAINTKATELMNIGLAG